MTIEATAADATPDVGTATRPRVEGDREQEILDAALDVLAEVGYDRLTMDAVAARARASKSTLYRRWTDKPGLIIDALTSGKDLREDPDTGTLRGDLLGMFCGVGGLTDQRERRILCSVMTALGLDEEFAEAFRRDFIAPKAARSAGIYERAIARGEVRDDVDIDLVIAALPGIVLHRSLLLGEVPDEDLVTRVVDQVILPAVLADPA